MKSKAQRRYLHAFKPAIAEKFESETPDWKKLPAKKSAIKRKKK